MSCDTNSADSNLMASEEVYELVAKSASGNLIGWKHMENWSLHFSPGALSNFSILNQTELVEY